MPVTRKLVILGDCMVGKSNVAIRFARDRFDPDTQPNFGAAFFECVRAHDGTPGGAVKWEIFDTSGQDRYRGMNAMYYKVPQRNGATHGCAALQRESASIA